MLDVSLKKALNLLGSHPEFRQQSLFIVGGTPRDILLDHPVADVDIACVNAPRLARMLAEQVKTRCVVLDGTPGRETLRVPLPGSFFLDFVELQGASIEDDLARRDFTLNAMAQTVPDFLDGKPTWIDPFKGREDIQKKIIRALPGNPMKDDPLRMLRGFRFAAQLEFSIEPATLAAIKRLKDKITQVAGERIGHELLLFLGTLEPDISSFLNCGLLQSLIQKTENVPADFLERGIQLCTLWQEKKDSLPFTGQIQDMKQRQRENVALFRLSLLLQSLATESQPGPEVPRQDKNSPLCKFLRDCKFSNEHFSIIERTIRYGLWLLQQAENHSIRPEESRQFYYRWIFECEDLFPQAVTLAILSNHGKEYSIETHLRSCFTFYRDEYLPALSGRFLINGDDLKQHLNLKPSPHFKTIIQQVEEARVLGTIKNREEALALARSLAQSLNT